jgi:hypothetical protein
MKPYSRTPAGSALLRLEQDVRDWIGENRSSAGPEVIEAAELLACNLYSAAHNGLGMERAALLIAIDTMASRQPKAAPSGREI